MAQLQSKQSPKELAPNLVVLRNKDRQMVKGKFIFHEVPGGKMEFPYRAYLGDNIETYRLTDGEVYTIPLGVYRHLNTNCWYPSYDFKNDEAGRPVTKITQKIRRCSFQSMEFLDIDTDVDKVPSPLEPVKEKK